jgi:hypothetical protein
VEFEMTEALYCNCGSQIKINRETPFSNINCKDCGEYLLDRKRKLLSYSCSTQLLKNHLLALKNEKDLIENKTPKVSKVVISLLITYSVVLLFSTYRYFTWNVADKAFPPMSLVILLSPLLIAAVFIQIKNTKSRNIHNNTNPIKLIDQYFNNLFQNRAEHVYHVVAPNGRSSKSSHLISFKNIQKDFNQYNLNTSEGYCKYWKATFKGDNLNVRSAEIKDARDFSIVEEYDDKIIFKISFFFTSYSTKSLGFFLIFNPIFASMLFSSLKKTESFTIRKVVIKHKDKWYVAEGELQNIFDFATFKENSSIKSEA